MRIKRYLAPTLVVALFAALLVQLPLALAARASDAELFEPLLQVRRLLLDRFVRPVDEAAMQQAMMEAMVASVKDPYTVYIPRADEAEFNKDLRGTYVGIGAEVNIIDNYLTIISPMDDSPALEAGVMAGDVVLEINGESTYRMPISRCIELLMGDPGTTVQIRVRHTGGDEAALTVTRRQIVARTVRGIRRAGAGGEWDYCLDAALGLSYIRISQFNESTFDELLEAMQRAQEPGLNGLVLDLRDDPGGGLNAAVQVADLFLEHGDIVAVRDRHGRGRTWSASPEGTVPDFPMIVLVNQYSASASEIVAGALQENGRAKVLGTRTYGKGSVQDVRPLDFNMGTFKFTTAQYFLPGGRTINREPDSAVWGVDPDPGFVVSISDDDYRAMLRARREYEILGAAGHDDGPCNDPSWLTERVRDVQLAAALAALRARVSGEGWPVVGEDSATIIAFDQEISAARERRQWLMDQLGQTEVRLAELEQRAAEAGRAPLLPPDVDLVAGTITIHDKHGNLIGGFRIEGGNLERALEEVTLSPLNRNDGPE